MDYKCKFDYSTEGTSDFIESYSTEWVNKFCSDQPEMSPEKAKGYIGSLGSSNIRNDILARNLLFVAKIMIKNNISEHFIPEDIDVLLHLATDQISNDPVENENIHEYSQFILAHMLLYEEFVPILSSKGVIDEMINNLFKPSWLLGLSAFCQFSGENRDFIFTQQVPNALLQYIQTKNADNLYECISAFCYSLCLFPIESDENLSVLSELFNHLIQLYSKFNISLQKSIIKALCPFSTLNEFCLKQFKSFHFFQKELDCQESFNMQLTPALARLLFNVTSYSLDFSKYLAYEENIWEFLTHYIGEIDPTSSTFSIFYKSSLSFARSAIRIAYAAPDYFIENQIYTPLINVMECAQFDLKYLIFTCLYAVLAAEITIEQAEFILNIDEYKSALLDDICSIDIYKPEFTFIGGGILNLFNFAQQKQIFELVQPFMESDDFIETFVNLQFDDEKIPDQEACERNKQLYLLIQEAVQSFEE